MLAADVHVGEVYPAAAVWAIRRGHVWGNPDSPRAAETLYVSAIDVVFQAASTDREGALDPLSRSSRANELEAVNAPDGMEPGYEASHLLSWGDRVDAATPRASADDPDERQGCEVTAKRTEWRELFQGIRLRTIPTLQPVWPCGKLRGVGSVMLTESPGESVGQAVRWA